MQSLRILIGPILKQNISFGISYLYVAFPGGSVVKIQPANEGIAGSIPGLGRSLEKEMATHSSILAWKIPWTEEPDGLQSMGSRKETDTS